MDNKDVKNMSWRVPEYQHHHRGMVWYIIALLIMLALIIFCVVTSNFLFAFFIIIAGAILVIDDSRHPNKVRVEINEDGLYLGQKFYDFDEFKNFAIVYKPKEEIKNLYFEFKGGVKPRLSIPLQNRNPLLIKNFLIKYLDEDLERTQPPLSERLGGILKL
jgi:hypothetical protein